MNELLKILNELYPDIDFRTYDANVDGPLLHSMELVELVTAIEAQFDIIIPPGYMGDPTYFHSAQAIWNLIQKLEDE